MLFKLNFFMFYFLKHFGSSGWKKFQEQADAETEKAIFVHTYDVNLTTDSLILFFILFTSFQLYISKQS